MTLELKRIPLGPVAKVGFLVYFAVTLAMFLIYSIFLGGMMDMVGNMIGEEMGMPVLTGGALIIGGLFLAVFLAVLYTLITLLATIIYNAIAGFAGGLELEVEDRYPSRAELMRKRHPAQLEMDTAEMPAPPPTAEPQQEDQENLTRFMPDEENPGEDK